ncbi:MAG TPA: cupin domain-containing protein [Candidatus Paceibacterota bacterium]|nr:cupin domain-containing protein [Candidatus Paceibacterota bacterium]
MKKGYIANIERLTVQNEDFRQVAYTAEHSQLVLMSLRPGEEIGNEVHGVDQFFRFEKGQGKAILNDVQEHAVSDGTALIVPAGTRHNIINVSKTEPLKLYTLYSPPHHRDGVVHATKAIAEADETDEFKGQTTE